MNASVICTDINCICGIKENFFYKAGVFVSSFIRIENSLENIRRALKFGFESSDGVCVIYSKNSWSNLQKTMLMEFERSSVFVDSKTPYVIANGFKEIAEGVYFDIVYNKPFLFISNEFKENQSLDFMLGVFKEKTARIGVFDKQINSRYVIYKDEVETLLAVDFTEVDKIIKTIDKKRIYTFKGESPQETLFKTLQEQDVSVSTAESCTAGLIAASIADIPGASHYLSGGCVTYSNEMKSRFVGVNTNTLNNYGAVSEEVASQMAIGVLNNTKTDFSIAVTGIAGPGGATNEKPVGLVYISAASRRNISTVKKIFKGNRAIIRQKTTKFALLFLRNFILSQ